MLDKLIREYIADMRAQGSSEATIKSYTSHLLKFKEWCNANGIDFTKLSIKDIKLFHNYLLKQDLAHHTVNMHIYCLKGFYDFLVEEGIVSGNPVLTRRLAIKEEKIRRYHHV